LSLRASEHGPPALHRTTGASVKEPLHRLSAAKLAQMISIGEASPETVTRSFIDAIREREPEVQAFAWFDADHALATARMLHLVSRRGPLHGVPFAVKDNIDTQEMPTAYGSSIYEGHRPDIDAICVAQLKGAGAFVLGKTVSAELANFTPGPTRNPHNPAHTPGGSSSGSAAAVAAHFAPIALGTQTAGSVIRPAVSTMPRWQRRCWRPSRPGRNCRTKGSAAPARSSAWCRPRRRTPPRPRCWRRWKTCSATCCSGVRGAPT
jgi:hypothetical protein